MRNLKKIHRMSLTEHAHLSIRKYILEGHLNPGERLTEDFFAQHLGISKSPVREALNTLQSEGLLRIEPRRGAFLYRFNAKEIKDLYELREALEVFAAVTVKITPQLVEELEASVSRTRLYLEQNEQVNYIEEDVRFHETIVGATENQELGRVFANLQNKLWLCRCQTYRLTSPDTPESHREISEALRDGDRVRAQEVTRRHIRFVRDALLLTLENEPEPVAELEPETVGSSI
jgi:DNA-binding GntR family transcriptional regulator